MIDGKEINITPASFGVVMSLFYAIARAVKENGIKLDLSSLDLGKENLTKMEIGDIGWIIEPILSLATDEKVRDLLFDCCKRAIFDKHKINVEFFEKSGNRKYYFPIMIEVLKVNLSPFFGLASSLFSMLPNLTGFLQKSKSPPE